MVSDKTDVLMKVEVHTGTRVDLSSQVGLPVSTLNTIMKNHETIERSYKCGSSCKQQK